MSDTTETILTDAQRIWWANLLRLWDEPRLRDRFPNDGRNIAAVDARLTWLEAERERLVAEIERWQSWEATQEVLRVEDVERG